MTAQDQQSRADFERELIANRQFKPSDFCFIDGAYTGDDAVQFAWDVWQAARAMPASMKPVAEIFAGDLFRVNQGPDAEPVTGDHDLYTAAQVQAMLAQGLAPGWQAVPVEPSGDMLVAIMSAGEVDVLRETPEKHQVLLIDRAGIPERYANLLAAAPQPPAAPATTEPQAPTTGAGSVTAGAAPAYRLLQPGVDTIQATDEVLADDVVTWKAVGRGIFAGMTYIGAMLPVRRALKTGP